MSGNSSKLIAFNYFGSKFSHVENLKKHFPNHFHFVDVFCGSMAVTLNKKPSKVDTANDINSLITTFFRVLREQPEKLIDQLMLTPVSREEFNKSWHMEGCTDMEIARRFYVRARQSFHGLGAQSKNKGWHLAINSSRCNFSETVSRWLNGVDKLRLIINRLREIQIENRDYKDLISVLDYPETFFYLDPPYPKDSRGSFGDYMFEFTLQQHEELAVILHGIKGKAMISGYDYPTMRRLYGDWRSVSFDVKHNNLRYKQVQEFIWMNYEPDKEVQMIMF